MKARLKEATTDETGAALIFALLIITVIALVSAGILTLGDTSIRSTVSMRERASIAYAGDAAGEIALNQLRKGIFNDVSTGCDASTTEVLSNLYPATATAPGASAAVTCTPDLGSDIAPGPNGKPGTAMLSLATGAEKGILLDDSNTETLKVKGGIFSNSTIDLAGNKADLENISDKSFAYSMNGCTGASQLIVTATSVKDCNYSANPNASIDQRGKDLETISGHPLSFDAPGAPSAIPVIPPLCTGKKVYELQPGLYTDSILLDALTTGGTCKGAVVHLNPGNYFFDFAAVAPTWTVSGAFLIGGTPTSTLKVTPEPTMSGTCVKPGAAGSSTTSGVELVFGGVSRVYLSGNGSPAASNGNIELCASNTVTGPPMVIYGLKTAVGTVPAQSGCITAIGFQDISDAAHCPVVGTNNTPYPLITLWGTTYVPKAGVELSLNNNTSQVFRWGLQARVIRLHATGSPSLATAVIDVPADAPEPFPVPAQRYLSVYVCPNSSTCTTSGRLRLRASVLLSSTVPKTVTVTSWATIR